MCSERERKRESKWKGRDWEISNREREMEVSNCSKPRAHHVRVCVSLCVCFVCLSVHLCVRVCEKENSLYFVSLQVSNCICLHLCMHPDPNLCDNSPCQNEGVCLDGLRSYVCVCQPGYYGTNCEKRECPPHLWQLCWLLLQYNKTGRRYRIPRTQTHRAKNSLVPRSIVLCNLRIW